MELYYLHGNAYDMVVSVDTDNQCRYLVDNGTFPLIYHFDDDEKEQIAVDFLRSIDDVSSWASDLSYSDLFSGDNFESFENPDGFGIIASIEKDL